MDNWQDYSIIVRTTSGHVGGRDFVGHIKDVAKTFCELRLGWKMSGEHGSMVLRDTYGNEILKAKF